MNIQSLRQDLYPSCAGSKTYSRSRFLAFLTLIVICSLTLCACKDEGERIDKPDEFTHVYEAKEKHILRAISRIIKDKDLGKPIINEDANEVTSDYVVQEDWRFRSTARVRKISWNEREVTLSIVSEKKTSEGWELRRLLGKEQYEKIFNAIDSQIYREMYKLD